MQPAGRELDKLIAEKVMGKHTVGMDLPPYSTYIVAAWEVVIAMEKAAMKFALGNNTIGTSGASVGYDSPWACFGVVGGVAEFTMGESIPHAICLAALKALA